MVVRGNRVEEFDFESANRRQLRGNIYLAKVTRVEPSLQAAFVEYGGNRHGFLAFSEIHPDYYQIPVADRQALIDEEERAHRDAEDEADRRSTPRATAAAAARPAGDASARCAAARRPTPSTSARAGRRRGRAAAKRRPRPRDDSARRRRTPFDRDGDADRCRPRPITPTTCRPAAATSASRHPGLRRRAAATGTRTHARRRRCGRTTRREAPSRRRARPRPDAEHERQGGRGVVRATATPRRRPPRPTAATPTSRRSIPTRKKRSSSRSAAPTRSKKCRSARPRYRRQYKIQEVIKRRQVMLVQVVKEERGTKGAALTTYLSLAGRYSVLMPNTARGGGICRKITSAEDRKRLKEIAQRPRSAGGHGRHPAHRRRQPHQGRDQARLRISAAHVGDGARPDAEVDRADARLRGRLADQARRSATSTTRTSTKSSSRATTATAKPRTSCACSCRAMRRT